MNVIKKQIKIRMDTYYKEIKAVDILINQIKRIKNNL